MKMIVTMIDDDGHDNDDDDDDDDVSPDRANKVILPRILKKHNIYFGKFTIFRKMSREHKLLIFRIC